MKPDFVKTSNWELFREGLTRNPVIIINPSRRCAALDGTPVKRARMQNCLVITYVANIEGVQVEWMVPDHG